MLERGNEALYEPVCDVHQMWKRAANSMSRGLNMGGNGITHALVEGNVESLQMSIAHVPRNVRAKWLWEGWGEDNDDSSGGAYEDED
eukprot:748833-Hanusia_phi.AAC.1